MVKRTKRDQVKMAWRSSAKTNKMISQIVANTLCNTVAQELPQSACLVQTSVQTLQKKK